MKNLIVILSFIFIFSCESDSPDPGSSNPGNGNSENGEWLIPSDEIYDGGPGKDGIPALEDPALQNSESNEHDYLEDDDLLLAINLAGTIRAYPHPVLDWHEIINDKIDDHAFAVNYCPLTGTGMAWSRVLKEKNTSFGVSGLLYNTNLILYDRLTDSHWSQMSLMAVEGELSGTDADIHPMIEMRWDTWKAVYPDAEIVIPPSDYSRPYGSYPYGAYKTDNDYLLFPVNAEDNRLPQKERVFGIIGDRDNIKIYRINQEEDSTLFFRDNYSGKNYVIAGYSGDFLVAYEEVTEEGDVMELMPSEENLPIIFKDASGSQWNIFGKAINGPNAGKKLKAAKFITGFWFTFPAFFNNVEIYEEP